MFHAGTEFIESVHYVANVWLPAKQIVAEAIQQRFDADPSGQIIVLKQVRQAIWAMAGYSFVCSVLAESCQTCAASPRSDVVIVCSNITAHSPNPHIRASRP